MQIQPLKLVKLHRVLREKNFGDPMSFALVEIRDEANRALYARDFRSLRPKFDHILNDGYPNQSHSLSISASLNVASERKTILVS